jgi:Flp pilus assembly protein TadG
MEKSQPHNSTANATSRAQRAKARASAFGNLVRRFRRDRSGSYVIIVGLAAPALVGLVGLGTEYGLWMYTHQGEQIAADAAAFSAADAYATNGAGSSGPGPASAGGNVITEAKAITASHGFADGQNDTTITVHRPATTGAYTTAPNSVEVIITQNQDRMFSALWTSGQQTIRARSVALGGAALGCVLALDGTRSDAFLVSGGVTINLTNCDLYDNSNHSSKAAEATGGAIVNAHKVAVVGGVNGTSSFHTSVGLQTGAPVTADPYASVSVPSFSGCNKTSFSTSATTTISPGVYCNGLTVSSPGNVTFNSGVYYIDRGRFTVSGGSSIHGTGVTIVLTSSTGSSYADLRISGSSTVNLTAPTSGALSGIVFYGDRNAPLLTSYQFTGGSTQTIGGAIYLPKGAITWSGGSSASSNCTQIIGDTINFSGSSTLALNCTGYGTASIGSGTSLVEGG